MIAVRAGAVVELQSEADAERRRGLRQIVADGPERLAVVARLFAETDSGIRLTEPGSSMGVSLWRRGRSAIWKPYGGRPLPEDPEGQKQALEDYCVHRQDVEDAINQLLGRDPEQRRPPRLSWDRLIGLLRDAGITVTEEELIAMPFGFEFSDELLTELALERGAG